LYDNFGVANEAWSPSPHATMSKAKTAADPKARNMSILASQFSREDYL
jgi:hypothetical protein